MFTALIRRWDREGVSGVALHVILHVKRSCNPP